MKEIDIDIVKIAKKAFELNIKIKEIALLFPDGNDYILKHLSAATIHIVLFMRDLYNITSNDPMKIDKEMEEKFLEACGCDFKNILTNEKEKIVNSALE